jgi:hypothetical protein
MNMNNNNNPPLPLIIVPEEDEGAHLEGDLLEEDGLDLEDDGELREIEDQEDDGEIVFILGAAMDFFQQALLYRQRRINRNPPIPFVMFNLNTYGDIMSERHFRFRVDEIYDIKDALRLPDSLDLDNGSRFSTLEGLCLVLRRLAYPCRLVDLMYMFGRSEGMLSRIISTTLKWIYNRWAQRLFSWDHARLTPEKLEEFATAIVEAGSPLLDVVGFIDGTVRPIARPTENQRSEYNGHHRVHAMKFQAVTTPDGIIVHLSGPYQGRKHDGAIYKASRLQATLLDRVKDTAGNNMCLFGDQGYKNSPVLQTIIPGEEHELTDAQNAFNRAMAEVRAAVEWSFGCTLQYFAFSELKKSQRALLSLVHLHYFNSVLFANIHSCITQNNSCVGKFGIPPPTLEEYLHD